MRKASQNKLPSLDHAAAARHVKHMNRRRFLAALALPALAGSGYATWRGRTNPYYEGPTSDHFDGVKFFIDGHSSDAGRMDLIKWRLNGEKAQWPQAFPSPHGNDRPPTHVANATRISYIGHASILIQTHGVNILIDPVWSKRASPFQFAGPARVNDPGIDLADLPPIDAVLVSHNHYDHLDLATLTKLATNPKTRFLAPLANDAIMQGHDPWIKTQTFDWGDTTELGRGVKVHFEPAYHWSARGLFDRRMALWCAFVIETPSGKIYHIADTAWGDSGALFGDMKKKHGEIKLAILPIGAYAPRWFMKRNHIDPNEAVAIMQACGAQQAMAHHWGTFQLTDEPIDEPPQLLEKALLRENIASDRFRIVRPGAALDLA